MCLVLAACGQDTLATKPDARPDDTHPDALGVCGIRTGMRGKTDRTIRAAALDRTYIVYLPPNVDPKERIPLVFVHHGFTMSGQAMFDITGYNELADAEHIAVAYPDGQGGPDTLNAPWNVGIDVCPAQGGGVPPNAPGDDFTLLDAIKADISADQCLDLDHIYVTAFSMGGYFSHHTGCMRDDIRAVAPHSGGTHPFDSCTTQHKPVIIFHGTSDTIVPNSCDDPSVPQPQGLTPSATEWARKNGCAGTVTRKDVNGGSCIYYDGCPADGQVALCTFTSMGHCWAGGKSGSPFACPTFESATQLEWAFFKQYAW
ncbi:MAG TPA: PHB depolymerase family esterase [Kofleriaceae bacterium]|nr:PHB depolymerase family esterase [Kofleriaceae bacterium]